MPGPWGHAAALLVLSAHAADCELKHFVGGGRSADTVTYADEVRALSLVQNTGEQEFDLVLEPWPVRVTLAPGHHFLVTGARDVVEPGFDLEIDADLFVIWSWQGATTSFWHFDADEEVIAFDLLGSLPVIGDERTLKSLLMLTGVAKIR